MISASTAKSASDSAVSGLTYIDTLITGATDQGLYSIIVSGKKITESMISTMRTNGYVVNIQYPGGNTDTPNYIIDWSV